MTDDAEKPKRILSLNDHKPKRQTNKEGQLATKDDVVASMSAGFLAMGQKVYTQAMEETARLLSEQEMRFTEEIAKLRAEVGLSAAIADGPSLAGLAPDSEVLELHKAQI